MSWRHLLGTCACLSIAACGSTSTLTQSSATGPATNTPASATPSPPPAVTVAQAAQAYSDWATAANKKADADNLLLKAAKTVAAQQAADVQIAADTHADLVSFEAIQFTSDLKADVNALIAAMSQEEVAFHAAGVSSNPTASSVQGGITLAGNAHSAAAGVLRHDLGLPPVPNSPRPLDVP